MLNLSAATRVFIALAPVDLRGSFNRLSARAQNQLAQDPLSGHLFVFTNRLQPAEDSVLGWLGALGVRPAAGKGALLLADGFRAKREVARPTIERLSERTGSAGPLCDPLSVGGGPPE